MDSFILGAASAFWFGILTSISPCPLATNIAAISFIDKHIESKRTVILSGLLYTLGRMLAYLGTSLIVIEGLLSMPQISFFLQAYMNKLLGPILLVVGIILLELVPFSIPDLMPKEKLSFLGERGSILGAGLLGFMFALSFCPVSAALFFGSLIPIEVKYQSGFLMPSLYGIGTGLPVFIFALIICFSTQSIGKAFDRTTQFANWASKITGIIFILVGAYYSLIYIFKISL